VAIILAFLVLLAVVVIVTGPLRRSEPEQRRDQRGERVAALEAAREAKYREVRDAELDYRTGKLSQPDFQLLDGSLRGEALALLRELDLARAAGDDQLTTKDA